MLQSKLFTKTRREAPSDETSKNAQILLRAGYISKEMAGAYDYLPLGLMVVEKIKNIVREEMNAIGSQEIIMTSLQRKELWEKTGRWDDEVVDVWFKSKLKNDTEIGFGWSHEEPITDMMRSFVSSFRDLPVYVYQFQTKMRNELRAKSGIMRGREFVMKDLYSYSLGEKDHEEFYQKVIDAYFRIFNRVGVGEDTFITFASGGAFTQWSHEFQTITDAGEDYIYINREKKIALNEEVMSPESLAKLGVSEGELEKVKTAEVGNIFNFGTRKCEELDLYYTDSDGKKVPVWLGSYGIGITRLMGVVVEKNSSENSLIWPESIAPFKYHIIEIPSQNEEVRKTAEMLYKKFEGQALYDDRDARAGEKFADADLLGMPIHIIVSERGLKEGKVEVKDRKTAQVKMAGMEEVQ